MTDSLTSEPLEPGIVAIEPSEPAALAVGPAAVVKRSGDETIFDVAKIRSAIARAGRATGEFDDSEADLLTSQAMKVLVHRFADRPPHIEEIQDVVEQVLISANHRETARAYIVYREQRARLRNDRRTVVEVETSMNEYLDRADWRVNANANQGLLARRPDPQRLGQGRRQLLAEPRLSTRSGAGAP